VNVEKSSWFSVLSGIPQGRCEATSDRLTAGAERPVTIIPLTVGLLSGDRVSLDSRKSRNSFPVIEKKIETLVNISKLQSILNLIKKWSDEWLLRLNIDKVVY